MKRYGTCICAFACFLSLTVPSMGQENPWNGSWKMDRSTLKYDGPSMSVLTDADGYTITRGGKKGPKVVCDGKPNPPDAGTVTTCTKTPTGYALENTRNNKQTSKVKIELSPDGKTMTRTAKIFPEEGSPFTMTFVSKRVSGGAGAAVVWKETSFDESQDTGVLTFLVKGDSIELKETDADKPVTCKLDGTAVPVGGTRTMSAKMEGPRTLKVTYSNHGEVQRVNTFVLSPDGKIVKETDVTPAPSPSTMSVSFHKS
jgi:hypothetical protein